MKTVCQIDKCAGCMLCTNLCSQGAITVVDSLKNYNAIIDEDKCIKCGLCYKKCPIANKKDFRTPISWNQGWANSEDSRASSSSGGFVYEIAYYFLQEGGVICACTYEKGNYEYRIIENISDLNLIRGSKYVKSNPAKCYKGIREFINQGKKVLYIGLPCHVAAVKNYIGSKNTLLYTIDLICHGTPSPLVLKKYLKEKGVNIETTSSNLSFREKSDYGLRVSGKRIVPKRCVDWYSFTFLNGVTYTENCYSCEFAQSERCSDITVGDSWGTKMEKAEIDKGVSLALCQTPKGEELLHNAKLNLFSVDLEKAVSANHQLNFPSEQHPKRNKFFSILNKSNSFHFAVLGCFPIMFIKNCIKEVLIRIRIVHG